MDSEADKSEMESSGDGHLKAIQPDSNTSAAAFLEPPIPVRDVEKHSHDIHKCLAINVNPHEKNEESNGLRWQVGSELQPQQKPNYLDGKEEEIGDEEEEEEEEEEGDDDDADEDDGEHKIWDQLSPQQKAKHAITGRGVTLIMLMEDGLIEPGDGVLCIDYLGQKFNADLLQDGHIRWIEENKIFGSPSAWAIHCKKIVNPMKKSGCGWASVRYKGKKLDAFKTAWLRKKRPATLSTSSNPEEVEEVEPEIPEKKIKMENPVERAVPKLELDKKSVIVKMERNRPSVKHATLGRKNMQHDFSTLVQCTSFTALGKLQLFDLHVATNALFMVDFHSHQSVSEVVGYLSGEWDPTSQRLTVKQAHPCKCRLEDTDNAPNVQNKIRETIEKNGQVMVGWYHSHPQTQPDPSLRDIESQMEYQIKLRGHGESFQPCVALICSPFDPCQDGKESVFRVVWVMAPPEQRPLDYGMPMSILYSVTQDASMSPEAMAEMKDLVRFYKGEPDAVDFKEMWQSTWSNLEKLKNSLTKKLPRDQTNGSLLNYVEEVINSNIPKSQTS